MSNARYSILPARAVFDARLSALEVRVLAALGTYSDNEGWCFPSQKTLTERLDCSRSSVGAAIKKLVEFDYLQVQARTAKGKGKVGNDYRVNTSLPPLAEAKKPMCAGLDIGSQAIETAPMLAGLDIGADVQPAGQPMSSLLDIGIYSLTTPSERPHSASPFATLRGKCSLLEVKAKAGAKSPKPRKPPKPRQTYPPAFDALWLSWPAVRRANSDKKKSFQRWLTGTKQFGVEAVAAAAKKYLARPDSRKDNFSYCCLAEVFLNGKLEAAVEATLNQAEMSGEHVSAEDAERRAARSYFELKGRWPQGYIPPRELAQ